ncbi:hypothetical protein QN362_00500 [Actimicrobium sp. CCC2.4]|uniref:hypothetical protein n=1 Tax=Actimicrobium sp. CCC2.4 TaxID=3048606 RepID=UPI002AC8F7A9|nr:hypothetical protein [Actimicrobium sp. CCC2.4]MEB0133805.1 hypothetical protein [Actimicrobium sp. CCC2.4]WPX31348.1 hypothetical protein RHM62_13980 [Actimicrobium sp. CCC2.4]
MSDELRVPTISDLASITIEDVNKFLSEKIKDASCPACTERSWSVIHDQTQLLSLIGMPTNGSFSVPPPAIPVIATVCVNCGYARVHVLGVIFQWKLDQSVAQ